MNKPCLAKYVLSFSVLLLPASALASNILGIVSDPEGKPINGVRIYVTGADGKVATQGRTDLYGRYCLRDIEPGTYTIILDPETSGVEAGNGVAQLELEGLTVDWGAARDKPAVASATRGVASKAAVTCGGGWWAHSGTTATAAAFTVTGGGVVGALCGTGVICGGSGHNAPPASSAQ